MEGDINYAGQAVVVTGGHALAYSLAVCLLRGGHRVTLVSPSVETARIAIREHHAELVRRKRKAWRQDHLEISGDLKDHRDTRLALAIAAENPEEKKEMVARLEKALPRTAVIAINTESIPLSALQDGALQPQRILGANWVEPVHTTCFLELIANPVSDPAVAEALMTVAREKWGKDPYLVRGDLGIRAKMFCAMVREAFYLVQHDYASIEDIDRACRNDAGYYLPFAGNFRYMDLMGTYAYGMVMKDLNPELCTDTKLPPFFKEILAAGGKGMETGSGFYDYTEGEAARWKERFCTFSYQIEEIIRKYPFGKR